MGKNRARSRSRGRRSVLSRRAFLAGGVLLAGSGALVSGTGAVIDLGADRSVSIDVADDENAIVGLDVASQVDAGESQPLVTVTNNAGDQLTASVSLLDGSSGSVSPSQETLSPDDTRTFTVDVSADLEGGSDALGFTVSATAGASFTATVTRTVGVRNFERNIDDRTRNTNAAFFLSYRVNGFSDFDRFELTVDNLDAGHVGPVTYSSTSAEDVLRHPSSGTDGGAEGDEYEFLMQVYDGDGLALQRTTTDVADGSDPSDNDDIGGGPNDPALESMTVTDNTDTQTDQTQFVVDYEVSNTDRFQEVRVRFDNTGNDWSDETVTSTDAPTGTVQYPGGGGTQGGTSGQEYDITVEVVNDNGLITDSQTVTDVADGTDP